MIEKMNEQHVIELVDSLTEVEKSRVYGRYFVQTLHWKYWLFRNSDSLHHGVSREKFMSKESITYKACLGVIYPCFSTESIYHYLFVNVEGCFDFLKKIKL